MNTLEYVHGSFVFRLQATANGFDSHVQIFSRRHFDNCLANGAQPWAFIEIKVKTDNGEFIVKPEYSPFVDFCEDWITNPIMTQRWARDEIENIRVRELRIPKDTSACVEAECEHLNNPHITQLSDFPYTVHTTHNN